MVFADDLSMDHSVLVSLEDEGMEEDITRFWCILYGQESSLWVVRMLRSSPLSADSFSTTFL